MPKLPDLSPSTAMTLALAVAGTSALALLALLALTFWNLHRNTLPLLRDQLEVATALMVSALDPALPPVELSRRLDRMAIRAGGVGFVLDAEDRLVAHPQIASGVLQPGTPARGEDAILTAYLSPQARRDALKAAGMKGFLIHLRGDDYGVAVRRLSGRPDWRLGFYVLRPSALALLEPADKLAAAVLAAALAVALLAWWHARARLKPLQPIARALDGMAGPEPTAVNALHAIGGPELRRAALAVNRLREVVRIYDGLLPRALARRLATSPGLLKPRRAEVVVLATGLADFAALVRALDDEAAVDLLRRHLTLVAGRVQAAGGTVVEVAGDGLLALWGGLDDEAAGGEAERALQAARAAARLVAEENARRRVDGLAPVRLCLGLAGGAALVGDLGPAGRIALSALGPAVGLARRLERACRRLPEADARALAPLALLPAAAGVPVALPAEGADEPVVRLTL